ncbi:hypothetical protein GOP47_0027942 [Adiantum capillus-veneris]|nr:hypothetical protein GOP47_0027942 [Adiantum capillus-veneris]
MAGTVSGVAADYDCPVCVGTQIFWLSKRRLRRHVLAFNAMDETWSILGQSWPEDLCPFALWAWDGHLCMAGGLFNALTVWELATNKSDWLRCIHVTSGVVHPGTFRGVGMMHAAGHGHLLCIMSPWLRKGFVFDPHSHSISWLPLCPVGFYIWGSVHPYMPGFSHLLSEYDRLCKVFMHVDAHPCLRLAMQN